MIPGTAAEALEKLSARAGEHQKARPADFIRFELSFDSSRPPGDTWAAEFDSGGSHDGWDHCSMGFGSTPLEAVEQCFDIAEAQADGLPGW